MRVVFLLLASCAVTAPVVSSTHPASSQARIGRLVGAPAALRTGVVTYDLPVAQPAAPHHHHM